MASSLYTLAQLQQLALDRLDGDSLFYGNFDLTNIINEAIRCVNLFTGFYQNTIAVPGNSVAGQLVYQVPAGIIFPLRVQFESQQLDPVPLGLIGQDYWSWATDTTLSLGPVARWVPIGINYFCIHPIDALGGGFIYVTGVVETPLLVLPDDPIPIEDEFVEIITEYVAHRAPLPEGGQPFSSASRLYQNFIRNMKAKTIWRNLVMPRYYILKGSPVEPATEVK